VRALRDRRQPPGKRSLTESLPVIQRMAIELAHAASDMDIEALMREPASVQAAVVTVLACGVRRDPLRAGPLSAIAQDRRWPARVRVAACRALAMIGDPGFADGLRGLAGDPDVTVRSAALKAQRRLESASKAGQA
jgi:HEAT repeat protein